uniref:Integrase catalytic domain-containing protein n=1 Tax=Fagus sylvatica TaxID=28930 RepID=A0A2N9FMC6_FAGSY
MDLHGLMKNNDPVDVFLQRVKESRDKLEAVDVHISDEEILHVVLKGLPTEFHSIRSAIRTRNDPISFNELRVLLSAEESSLKTNVDAPKDPPLMAMLSTGNRFPPNHNPPQFNNSSNRGRGRNNNGRVGHLALDCYHRMDYSYQGRHPPAKLVALASSNNLLNSAPNQNTSVSPWHNQNTPPWAHQNPPWAQQNPSSWQPLSTNQAPSTTTWVSDTGATDHFTPDLTNLNNPMDYPGSDQVSIGNGTGLPITHIGHSQLKASSHIFNLRKILRVPCMKTNLLSVNKFCCDNACSFYFDANKFSIQDIFSGRTLYKGSSKDGLYPILGLSSSQRHSTPCHSSTPPNSAFLGTKGTKSVWHSRLGHPQDCVLHSVLNKQPWLSVNTAKFSSDCCTHCVQGKLHQFPFPSSSFTATAPLELVHSDVWGPAPVTSINGTRFYVSFVDHFTRFTWLFPIKHKSQVLATFQHFTATMENILNTRIKVLRTDCGGEYTNSAFESFCSTRGILHQFSCPHTPQQNGVAERKHRHIVETALTLISESSLPLQYWPYAFSTAIYLINRMPTPNLKFTSPWQLLFHTNPDYSFLKTFGCLCFPLLRPYNKHKLEPRSSPCVFLGYALNAKGYLCLNLQTHKLLISRHVAFHENSFPFKSQTSPSSCSTPSNTWLSSVLYFHPCTAPSILGPPPSLPPLSGSTPLSSSLPDVSAQTEPPSPLLHTTSSPHISCPVPSCSVPSGPILPPINSHPMQTRGKSGISKRKLLLHTKTLNPLETEPPSYKVASKYPEWQSAMLDEYTALQRQQTWSLVPPPSNHNIVGCKWVYKIKRKPDGSVARYKARLVAKGYHQQAGLDYDETFSPVVKPATVRLILSIAAQFRWSLRQLDVSNAFLHRLLKEDVYMVQPQGFVDSSRPHHVCKLQKSLYGLKQAPRAWFERFTSQLLVLGFTASTADPSLFIYRSSSTVIFLLVYVDDIIITGNSPSALSSLVQQLATSFELKDLGPLTYFLGLEVDYSATGFFVHQHKYASDLLQKYNMWDCKPCSTPCCTSVKLTKQIGTPLPDATTFRSLVGALQYLTFTRPDLAYTVNSLCQFMHAPTDIHLSAAKRVLRYIRGSLHLGLTFSPGSLQLHAYSDADWAGDPDTRRSTTGYIVFMGTNPLTWVSKKQSTVSRSSTEAEYRALASCAAEVSWLRMVLHDLGISLWSPPTLWCDNVSALALASNPVFHARTKHIEVDYHFIRDRVVRKDLQVRFINSGDQLADILTKGLALGPFSKLCGKLLFASRRISLRGHDKIHEKAPDPSSHDKDGKYTWPSVIGSLTAST